VVYDLVIIGGGAAGFFGAIRAAELHPAWRIIILEKGKNVLEKVRISGGGRCNVTHACYVPKELIEHYPRGSKELLSPFHQFMCGDMIEWLSNHGVEIQTEEDGRIFPASNSSTTIVNLYISLAQQLKIDVQLRSGMENLTRIDDCWEIASSSTTYRTRNLLIATGSSKRTWELFKNKSHQIAPIAPSLFTFKIKDELINELAGISVPMATVSVKNTTLLESGSVLITHQGLSGPGVLKLSAWGAIELQKLNYQFTININWTDLSYQEVIDSLNDLRNSAPKSSLAQLSQFGIPKRLWKSIIEQSGVKAYNWAETSKKHIQAIAKMLTQCELLVTGKNTFKDEFVTCGGIKLEEVNFKTMQSKILPQVYFAGEVLNIDAITGGFNFQAAWTTSWLAASSMR